MICNIRKENIMLIEFTKLDEKEVWVEPKNIAYVMKGALDPEVTVIQFIGTEGNYITVKESLERVINDLYAAELS